MDFKKMVKKTRQSVAPKLLVYSEHGLGKSSLAAAAPSPLFIDVENGLAEIDTDALDIPATLEDVQKQLSMVLREEHQYKTLVIDTLDWLETRINEHICRRGSKNSISDFGYGAGFQQVFEETVKIVKMLDEIHTTRGMCIVLLSHTIIKTFQNPLGMDYDTYRLKLREKNAELYLEFATLVGFLRIPVVLTTEEQGFKETTKAISSQERVLSVVPNAGYSAKNRYWITEDIAIPDPKMGWSNLINAIKSNK